MLTTTRQRQAAYDGQEAHGYVWGLSVGLIPNLTILVVMVFTPWTAELANDVLFAGVLVAGPMLAGVIALALMCSRRTRRCGVGLALAALLTVAMWFVAAWLTTWIAFSSNTGGG